MLKLVAHKVKPRLSMVNVDISIHTAWSLQSSCGSRNRRLHESEWE